MERVRTPRSAQDDPSGILARGTISSGILGLSPVEVSSTVLAEILDLDILSPIMLVPKAQDLPDLPVR